MNFTSLMKELTLLLTPTSQNFLRVTLILWEPSERISNHPAGVNAIWQPLLPFEITIHNGKCFVAMATVDHIRDCSWFVLVEDSTYVMFSVRLLIMSWPHFNLLDKCHRMGNEWTDFNAIRTVILFAFIVPEKCKTWINSFFSVELCSFYLKCCMRQGRVLIHFSALLRVGRYMRCSLKGSVDVFAVGKESACLIMKQRIWQTIKNGAFALMLLIWIEPGTLRVYKIGRGWTNSSFYGERVLLYLPSQMCCVNLL